MPINRNMKIVKKLKSLWFGLFLCSAFGLALKIYETALSKGYKILTRTWVNISQIYLVHFHKIWRRAL